jgi:aryl-phospho-beta-D-glucosidase BglC (GH1 family)
MGFRHVRFTFNNATVVDPEKPRALNPEKMKLFDQAMDFLLAADLAVIIDFHPEDDFKRALEEDDAAVGNFVGMWRSLSRHLSSRDPEKVFFEVMNEPIIADAERWNTIQKKVLETMRESAPHHTLIACGPRWSSVDQLELVEVVADRNVVYNFHCYAPFFFTHQGATWAGPSVADLKNLPYPSSPETVARILDNLANEKARENAGWYGNENWDCIKIDAVIARAAAWGIRNSVTLTCNEFGVYRKYARASARARCLRDVRRACEKYNIGWCMWDYAGGFSVVTGPPGERVADSDTLRALGLVLQQGE